MPLFNCSPDLPNCFNYYVNCISEAKSDALYNYLVSNMNWQQPVISMFGKQVLIPRKQVYMSDGKFNYAYSGMALEIEPWDPILEKFASRLTKQFEVPFNAVLVNWYRDGNDSVGWHADDEAELGVDPVIASISLGDRRLFKIKNVVTKQTFDIQLENGSCLLMSGKSQSQYQHCLPKMANTNIGNSVRGRINLTFRYIHPDI
ncbi:MULTISPECIES: alpha-ketoglutarate-dependent dioxygenase AlkB [unclassified Pseudoalteromonas]|uniref:alpha-ketoglutarate-dependent dioxygenase AlkB family protein n=1 Tax=unclassified Pseudoalteromonas TaxID=194690 RepID=UPI0005A93075|nr:MULTISPECIES: alpha-ketoglutarate-dependent dioxygenase AlkB [unclassified Pseudoalteromonas]